MIRSFTSIVAALVLAAFMSGGCKKKSTGVEDLTEASRKEMTPVLAKHRAAATAKMQALRAVATAAKDVPPVTAREALTAAAAAGSSSTTRPAPLALPERGAPESAGVLIANIESLAATDGTDSSPVRLESELRLGLLSNVLASGHAYNSGYTATGVHEQFVLLNGLRHVAVVRVRRYDPPKAVSAGGQSRFEAGRATGDILVYDFETRTRVGTLPFEVVQQDSAYVETGRGEGVKQQDLERNFTLDFGREIRAELAAYAAGRPGPATPGSGAASTERAFADKIKEKLALDHLLAGPREVEIAAGAGDTLIVTIRADNPSQLATRDGNARLDVRDAVTKILGREAEVRIESAKPR